MTETESPSNPVKNGTEFSTTDFGKMYSSSQYIEKVNESSIPQNDINSSNTNTSSQTQPSDWHDNDSKEKIEQSSQNSQFKTSDEISVEQPKQIEVNDIEIEDNIDDCHCQKISVMPGTAACIKCDRVIPILVDLNRKRLQLLDDLEEANIRKKEGFEKVERQNDEIENLGKRIMELEDQLDSKVDEFSSLQDDMNTLNEKYVKVIDRVAELQHSKDMVESELEELSRSLFEQANGMVASEAKQRHELEIQQKILEKQLLETQERLSAESMQLKELREKMEQLGQEQPQAESKRSSSSDPSFRASIDFAELFGLRERSPEAAANLPGPTGEDGMGIDTELLAEFKEFVESSMNVRLQRIHTIPFMKHCLEEDVDPCMRFGNNPRVSSRKIIDAIVANTCFIEEAPPGAEKELALNPNSPIRNTAARPALWDRIAGNPTYPKTGCQCCGRPGPLPFQYRITNLDDWSLIDRYCRDRLVAVCEFYVFIRNVRSSFYSNRVTSDLYSECLRLRLQMFYARLGALPSMLNTLGIKGTELASARKPTYMLENPTIINREEPFSVNMTNEPEEIITVSSSLKEYNSNINQQNTPPEVVIIEPSRPNSSTNIEIENTG